MIKHSASHLDHSLTEAQVTYLLERFADRQAFFVEIVELPEELGTVPCGLYGPIMGDPPVRDGVVYAPRGTRTWASRLCARPPRPTRKVTVVAGPHAGEPCIVYTMYGGPSAPQEPDDPGCRDVAASRAFWADHALADE